MAKDKVKAGKVFEFNNGVKTVKGHVAVTSENHCIVHDPVTREHIKVIYSEYTAAQVTDMTPDPIPEPIPGDTGGSKPPK